MICKECGNEILPDTMFCPNCGAKAEVPSQEADFDKTAILWSAGSVSQSQSGAVPGKCPNCGSVNTGDALFCAECGVLMTETKPQPATPPSVGQPAMMPPPQMRTVGKAPKEKGTKAAKSKKLPIIIGAVAAVVVVIIGAMFVMNGLSSKSVRNDLVYLKDNELYLAHGNSFKPELITDSFCDDEDDAPSYGRFSSGTTGAIQFTDDGKYMFYLQDIDGSKGDLYYKKVGSKEEGIKLESGISSSRYLAYSQNLIVYEKSDKLYLASLKSKEKIASDPNGYNVSKDRKYVCWYDEDHNRYIQDVNLKKDKVKIKDVSYLVYSSDDMNEIYYMSDDTLYLMKNLKDKVKISSNVKSAYMLGEGDNKTLYYFKLEDEKPYTCADLVKNDVKEDSEYYGEAEYILEDLEYYKPDISEYKAYSYSAGTDKSEEVASFTGCIIESIYNYEATEKMLLYCAVNVEESDKLKLSDIIEDYYYDYTDISIAEAFKYNLLSQAEFYLMTDDGLIPVAGMEEFYEEPEKMQPSEFALNSVTKEIYMTVYCKNKDDVTYDLYVIPYTDKEVECRLITNEVYGGKLIKANQGVYYVCDVDKDGEEGILFLNGIEMAKDVYPNCIEPSEDAVYYLKDINSDHDEGTLYMNKKGKETEIAEDVAAYYYQVMESGNIAYFVDYSFKKYRGDLFVFMGKKSIAIDEDVSMIYKY